MEGLTFLGTGGSFVSKKRACSGLFVDGNLVDCGFGVLANLRRARIALDRVNRVCVTHVHSDHIGDFTGMIWAMALEGRRKRLEVVSSKEAEGILKEIMALYSTPTSILKFEIAYVRPDELHIDHCKTDHKPLNYAYRLEVRGKAVTCTGDTRPCDQVVELARDSDLLVHDCTYLSANEELGIIAKHSTPRQAMDDAKRARVSRLVLNHLFPGGSDAAYRREAGNVKGIECIVARDLLTIPV